MAAHPLHRVHVRTRRDRHRHRSVLQRVGTHVAKTRVRAYLRPDTPPPRGDSHIAPLIREQRISRGLTHTGVLEVQEQVTADGHLALAVILRVPLVTKLIHRAAYQYSPPPVVLMWLRRVSGTAFGWVCGARDFGAMASSPPASNSERIL